MPRLRGLGEWGSERWSWLVVGHDFAVRRFNESGIGAADVTKQNLVITAPIDLEVSKQEA